MVEFSGQMYMRLSDWNTLRLLKSQPKGVDGHGSLILLLICMVTLFHLGYYLQQSLTAVQFAIVTWKPGFP